MGLTYKIVSDWNLKTDLEGAAGTGGVTTISEDVGFSSSALGGNYDIVIDGGITHGVFSKSGSYTVYYFTYESGETYLEKILIGGNEVLGVNARIVVDGLDIYIMYYDIGSYSVSILKNSSGSWTKTIIDYVIIPIPPNKRQIYFKKVGSDILGAYVCNFSGTDQSIKYVEKSGSRWVVDEAILEEGKEIKSVYCHKKSGIPLILFGGNAGLSVYKRIYGNWIQYGSYSGTGVSEMHAAYANSVSSYHIAYLSGSEVRYQKFNTTTNAFLGDHKFIDFSSNSISIALNSSDQPAISYSHIEEINPITSFLKVARGQSDGLIFKTYNVKSSSSHQYAGYLSDIEMSSYDKLIIAYYNSSIKIYDELLDIEEDELETSVWKDRTFVNNLVASPSPPTRDSENTYMQFTRANENYFYIEEDNQSGLDKSETGFSIALTIIPSGDYSASQNIVSKISSEGSGYELFLGGANGLWIGFSLSTIYGSVQSLVLELPPNEASEIAMVYSGFDIKIYVKRPSDSSFSVKSYSVAGDVLKNNSPFVIGAYGYRVDSADPYYPYQDIGSYIFSNFLDAKLLGIKYWKRELSFEEATYGGTSGSTYSKTLDPYSDNLDYRTSKSSFGDMHFFLNGNNLSTKDYGGVRNVDIARYSNYNLEERVTNASGYSIDPKMAKKRDGSVALVWSDKRDGYAEIYINEFYGNNAISSADHRTGTVKVSGLGGQVAANSNVFIDSDGKFLDRGVLIGDCINITSGNKYQGRRVPIISVLSNSTIEVGAFFSEKESGIGYYVDFNKPSVAKDYAVKVTGLKSSSINPVILYDSLGDAHIVFQSLDGEYYSIYYSRYRGSLNSSQIWSPIKLTSAEGNSSEPSLAIDSTDSLHLVWSDARNGKKSVFYAKTSMAVENGAAQFPYWTSSGLKGKDRLISSDIVADRAKIYVDNSDVSHIVFSGRVNPASDLKKEIYYVDNYGGRISNPIRISYLGGRATAPVIVGDSSGNQFVIFSAKIEGYYDIYVTQRNSSLGSWRAPKKVSLTSSDSVDPTAVIDSDGVIYIHWIDKSGESKSIGYAEYYSADDRIVNTKIIRPSSAPTSALSISSLIDDTKTVYVSWEDSRSGEEGETEIYKNENTNLVTFDEPSTSSQQDKTLSEIIADQMSQVVVGREFSDIVSASELPISGESLGEVEIVLFTDSVSYSVPFSLSNIDDVDIIDQTIIMDYRRIGVKIKGLNKTIAYRIKNKDDSSSTYSEFYEFTIDEPPNTTTGSWTLSQDNGRKQICVQLYTIKGLTSEFCIDLFLNEPSLFDISIHSNTNNNIGEVVDTEYQEVKALTSDLYWVKILPRKLLTESQTIVFDIETQGNKYSSIQTSKNGDYYIGKFALNTHDGVRYVDGGAKIIPRIVSQ